MRNFITNLLILISLNIFSQSTNEIKDFDGNSYKTENLGGILISTSTLNVTHFNNGDKIFEVNSIKTLNEATKNKVPAYCHFKFDKSKTTLYNWYAVNDKRGLAPKGYKIPTDEEWKTLVDFCGGIMEAGKKLKSATGWNDKGNGAAPNGFNGLPGGFCLDDGMCAGLGSSGAWWTSSAGQYDNTAWDRYLEAEKNASETYSESHGIGFSVRCIKVK